MKNPRLLWEHHLMEMKKEELQTQLKKIPEHAALKKLKSEIEDAQKAAREIHDKINDLKKKSRFFESNLAELQEKLKKADEEMYHGSQSSRELEAGQKNILILKEKIEHEEDDIFNLMEQIEDLQAKMAPVLKTLEEKKENFRSLNKIYSEKKEALTKETVELEKALSEISNQINAGDIEEYKEMGKKYPNGSCIAILQNGICSGCHMTLSFESLKRSKTGNVDLYCDNCGRLLLMK